MKKLLFTLIFLVCSSSILLSQINVAFQIRNEQVVGGNYEFDVYMVADAAGTFHSRGQLYINFNPLAFGNSPVTNGNVTSTHLALLNEVIPLLGNAPKYTTVNTVDNGSRIVITWQSLFLGATPSSLAHTEVPITPTPLYHFSVVMANPAINPNLFFSLGLMAGQQYYLSASGSELPYGDATLPVELLSFTADKANDHDVSINWATAAERNSDYFILEKQKGQGEFQEIARVDAAGFSDEFRAYSHLDQTGMANVVRYRLRQVDIDGTFSLSNTVELTFDFFDNDKFVLYPNPAKSFSMIKANGPLEGNYTYRLSDLQGRSLMRGVFEQSFSNEMRLDVSRLAAGTYYLTLTSPLGKSYMNKLSIQR